MARRATSATLPSSNAAKQQDEMLATFGIEVFLLSKLLKEEPDIDNQRMRKLKHRIEPETVQDAFTTTSLQYVIDEQMERKEELDLVYVSFRQKVGNGFRRKSALGSWKATGNDTLYYTTTVRWGGPEQKSMKIVCYRDMRLAYESPPNTDKSTPYAVYEWVCYESDGSDKAERRRKAKQVELCVYHLYKKTAENCKNLPRDLPVSEHEKMQDRERAERLSAKQMHLTDLEEWTRDFEALYGITIDKPVRHTEEENPAPSFSSSTLPRSPRKRKSPDSSQEEDGEVSDDDQDANKQEHSDREPRTNERYIEIHGAVIHPPGTGDPISVANQHNLASHLRPVQEMRSSVMSQRNTESVRTSLQLSSIDGHGFVPHSRAEPETRRFFEVAMDESSTNRPPNYPNVQGALDQALTQIVLGQARTNQHSGMAIDEARMSACARPMNLNSAGLINASQTLSGSLKHPEAARLPTHHPSHCAPPSAPLERKSAFTEYKKSNSGNLNHSEKLRLLPGHIHRIYKQPRPIPLAAAAPARTHVFVSPPSRFASDSFVCSGEELGRM